MTNTDMVTILVAVFMAPHLKEWIARLTVALLLLGLLVLGCGPAPEHTPTTRVWNDPADDQIVTALECRGSQPPVRTWTVMSHCNCRITTGHWITGGRGLSFDLVDVPEEEGMLCEGCFIGMRWVCADAADPTADTEFNR